MPDNPTNVYPQQKSQQRMNQNPKSYTNVIVV